jgi:hypothetical protein
MSDVTNIGNEIGQFIGGVVNPVIGTTTTTVTTPPKDNTTMKVAAVIVGILILAAVAYVLTQPKTKPIPLVA